MVHLYPPALQQGEALGPVQKGLDFLPGKGHAVHRQLRLNRHQRVKAQPGRLLPAQTDRQGDRRGPLAPPVGHPAQDTGLFQLLRPFQKLIGLLRRQAQGMEQLTGGHEFPDQRHRLRRPVQAGQQLQQLAPVRAVLRQGVLQRHMGDPAVFIPCGVGGEKGEGEILVATLHQVEKDPFR